MIYYTNTSLQEPHMAFIGRWSPLHQGHIAIVQSKRLDHPNLPVLMMVRDTKTEAYPATVRAEYIKLWMVEEQIKGTIMIIPNIEGVYWGRDVGYHVGEVNVDDALKRISGTNIRSSIGEPSKHWQELVASKASAPILSPRISAIQSRGLVIWLTGCPSSGKTTIARSLDEAIHRQYPYLRTCRLDGDDMRTSPLAVHVGFTKKDRAQHIRRMAYMAKMFADCGVVVICSFVSPDRPVRSEAKHMIGADRFTEVYVHAKKSTRYLRDVKGLYKKAKEGKITNLTGYNAPYQKPIHPNVRCNTDLLSVSDCVRLILNGITSVTAI